MNTTDKKRSHWQGIYSSKADNEVSWYQQNPETSLNLIQSLSLDKKAAIIDVGGGNSELSAKLQRAGFQNLSVLDISAKAIERSKAKLDEPQTTEWIVSDILDFQAPRSYQLWHDRATFHFLTDEPAVKTYLRKAGKAIAVGGYLILATFSKSGPEKCSGLSITQYDAEMLDSLFQDDFKMIRSFEETHHTPFGTQQNFVYAVFQKR